MIPLPSDQALVLSAVVGTVAIAAGAAWMRAVVRREMAVRIAEAVRASESRFRSLVQHSSDLIFLLDAEGIIQFASASAVRLVGYESDALEGVALSVLVHPDDVGLASAFTSTATRVAGTSPAVEWRLRRRDGSVVHIEALATNLLNDSTVRGVVLNARDVGERKALLDQFAHQAFHDPLTGLANRVLFQDRVMHGLAMASRQGRSVRVLYMDLDGFKRINDTHGHPEGDRVLTMVAARLRACARATDTVARLGGDEFAVLVEGADDDEATAELLVARIREQMAYPFAVAGKDEYVGISIGVAAADGGPADDVLRRADVAMYEAKRGGRTIEQ